LTARVGIGAALALLRSAQPVDAVRAKECGLVSEMSTPDERAARLDRLGHDAARIDPTCR